MQRSETNKKLLKNDKKLDIEKIYSIFLYVYI